MEHAILAETIDSYWDERSGSYSASVREELDCDIHSTWAGVLERVIPGFGSQDLRVLDIGCGPGFFSILSAEAGCTVDAIDGSIEMLVQAQRNAQAHGVDGRISLHHGDVQALPFESETFDAVISRNVTWNLSEPMRAYREWGRVLKHGGKLVNFDANWYSYLVDNSINEQRALDQQNPETLGEPDECRATDDQCDRCERIAQGLPLTRSVRPAWDTEALKRVGFSDVYVNTQIYREVWTPGEQAYYASSPLFMIAGTR